MKVDMSPAGITARLHEMDDLWELSGKLMNAGRSNRPVATRGLQIYDSIREILVRDWDPFVIGNDENRRNDYDECIAPIYRILVGTRSKEELIEYLQLTERDEFGVGPFSAEELSPVVEKLLSLNVALEVDTNKRIAVKSLPQP